MTDTNRKSSGSIQDLDEENITERDDDDDDRTSGNDSFSHKFSDRDSHHASEH